MEGKFGKGKRRNYASKKSFNPNHDFIKKAVSEYVRKGGKITRINKVEFDPTIPGDVSDVDDFLSGG